MRSVGVLVVAMVSACAGRTTSDSQGPGSGGNEATPTGGAIHRAGGTGGVPGDAEATGGDPTVIGGRGDSGGLGGPGGSAGSGGSTTGGRRGATGGASGGIHPGGAGAGGTEPTLGGSGGTGAGGAGGGGGGGTAGTGAAGGGECVDACSLHGAACCFESSDCLHPGSRCEIDVLATQLSPPYEYADLEEAIAELPPDLLVSLTDTDIEWVAADPPPASRFELHLTRAASEAYGVTLEGLDRLPFRISCDGHELFVGVSYLIYGAAAIETPVLHVDWDEEDRVVLQLGAYQGAWALWSPESHEEERERLDRPELRAVFCQRGALQELDAGGD